MPFTLSGFATLRAITISSAGGAENPSPYVTLKVEADQQDIPSVLAAVGAADCDRDALLNLHDHSDPLRPPRFAGITGIDTWYEARGRHTLTFAGIKTRVAKVSGVSVKIAPRACWTITCNLGIDELPQSALDRLAQALKGTHKITLEADPELDLKPASAQAHPYDAAVGELRRMAAQDGIATIAAVKIAAAAIASDATKPKRGKPAGKQSPAA